MFQNWIYPAYPLSITALNNSKVSQSIYDDDDDDDDSDDDDHDDNDDDDDDDDSYDSHDDDDDSHDDDDDENNRINYDLSIYNLALLLAFKLPLHILLNNAGK